MAIGICGTQGNSNAAGYSPGLFAELMVSAGMRFLKLHACAVHELLMSMTSKGA
jgi:hypothetical protein